MSLFKKKSKKEEKKKAEIQDAYDESDRTMSDEEALRDAVFKRSSFLSQLGVCYMTQLKRFTKQKIVWLMLILLVAIPVGGTVAFTKLEYFTYASNSAVTLLLALMPVMSMFLVTFTCSSILPQEFNERTVYLSLPLPMSRFTFFLGKFLAGFSLSTAVVLASYGFALMTAGRFSEVAFTESMKTSIPLMICAMFFFCALTYMFSAKSKKGAPLKSLIVLVVLIPALCLFLNWFCRTKGMDSIADIIVYMPVFAPDLALYVLGPQPVIMGVPIPNASIYGLLTLMQSFGGMPPFILGKDPVIMCTVAIALGVLALAFAYRRIARRDM